MFSVQKKNELNPELVGNTFIFVRLPQRFSTYFLHWNVFREKKNRRNWIHLHWCWRKWAELLNVLWYTSTRTAAHHCVVYRPKADFFSAKKGKMEMNQQRITIWFLFLSIIITHHQFQYFRRFFHWIRKFFFLVGALSHPLLNYVIFNNTFNGCFH